MNPNIKKYALWAVVFILGAAYGSRIPGVSTVARALPGSRA